MSEAIGFKPGELLAAYCRNRIAWCVYVRVDDLTMEYRWRCHNEKAARKLARDINDGAEICRGSRDLGSACGKCVKCELSKD